MRIFYSGNKFDHYDLKRGLSFEHVNFYESLRKYPGAEVVYFPLDRIIEVGKKRFNEEIFEAAKKGRPDLYFFFMYSDELDKDMLEEFKKFTVNVAWFADDSWRFYNYSRFWAPYFTWVVTTYSWMPELYKKIGQPKAIRSQWAANINIYKPLPWSESVEPPEVSFVGGWSRPREKILSILKKAGINVVAYGSGWPAGRVSEQKMLEIFANSKINLALNPSPGYFNKNSLGRLFFKRSINKIVPDFHLFSNWQSWLHRGIPQIKARHFEIPACGGFIVTSMADDLGSYYKIGEEIIIYKNLNDLIKKIKYFLNHNEERKKIAKAGYERTIRDHTYTKRFQEIFRIMKLI